MSYKNYGYKSKRQGRVKSKRARYADRITRLAKDLGAITRGMKNPDSRVSQAYKEGENPSKRNYKTLF